MLRGVRIPTNRPPSCRTHSITMRVGPGGGHTYSIRIVRSGRPVPSGRIPAREGVVSLGAQCHLVPAARPRTLIKVSRSWRKCERCRWPWVPVLKWPRETVLRHSRCFSTPPHRHVHYYHCQLSCFGCDTTRTDYHISAAFPTASSDV